MSEALSSDQAVVASRHWLDLTKRILVGILIFLAVLSLIIDLAGLVGVWVARGPASNDVTDVTTTAMRGLNVADNGLARVNTLVVDARQTVAQINTEAAQLGDRVDANSPVVNKLSQLVESNLGPRIENMNINTAAIRDAVVTVSTLATVVKHIPGIELPSLSPELTAVTDRAREAQSAAQDLRARLATMKAGVVAKAEAVVTQITARVDAALSRLQALINKYQAQVTQGQTRVTTASNQVLLLINVLAVSLTILALIFAAGLLVLMIVCWEYIRTGHFPSLRVVHHT